jgi:hypothetical protein
MVQKLFYPKPFYYINTAITTSKGDITLKRPEVYLEPKERAAKVIKLLGQQYPNAKTALNYSTPLELLVATMLSAQTTDQRVNIVTQTLFKK